MQDNSEKNKQVTESLLEKSKTLRAKAKATENKLNELRAKVNEFIHPDRRKKK